MDGVTAPTGQRGARRLDAAKAQMIEHGTGEAFARGYMKPAVLG